MSDKTPKLRALAIREIRLAKPSRSLMKKAAAALDKLDIKDVHKQVDLLHVEAVLVTEGINDNDDAFTRDELKRALSSPILKPMNWQHKDDNILGVMYSVEARDLDGNVLEEIGDEQVELVIQGAVWHHLPHIKSTAQEILKRIEKNTLFVSMECWFDDYDFALYSTAGELCDTIKRNDETAFLDKVLRANGGTGRHNGYRVGRALSGINFGGIAFVDRPANKRSYILNSFAFNPLQLVEALDAKLDGSGQGLDQSVTNNVVSDTEPKMEVSMNDLNRAAASGDEIQKAVEGALESRERVQAQKRQEAELATAQSQLAKKDADLAEAKTALETIKAAIDRAFDGAKATATPDEIAKIDQALQVKGPGAGEAVFAAKIAWIEDSRRAAAAVKATAGDTQAAEKLTQENALLRKELATLKSEIRQAEIEHLFRNILEMSDDEVATFVKAGLAQASDEAYTAWLDEKKLFAKKLFEKMGKKKKEEAASDSEAGLLSPSDRETPVEDHGAVLRPNLGRVPSDVRRVPRSKLTAAQALDAMFEEVVEPDLAGANAGDVKADNPMKGLVASLLGNVEEKKE